MTNAELKLSDIKHLFNNMPLVYFATATEGQPRVRPMALIYNDDKYWLTSRAYDLKMKEIKQNSKMEFTFRVVDDDYNLTIRATGHAFVVQD